MRFHFLVSPRLRLSPFLVRFSPSKVDTMVVEIDGTKSPGSNGFIFSFSKKFWGLVKEEVYELFD